MIYSMTAIEFDDAIRKAAAGLAVFERVGEKTVRVTRSGRVLWIALRGIVWLVYTDRGDGYRYAVKQFTFLDNAIEFATHDEQKAAA